MGHVVLNSTKPRELEAFFVDVLGFRLSDYIHAELAPGMNIDLAFLRCNPRHHTVAITSAPIPVRVQHFMLEMNSLDDVGSTYDIVQQRGIPLTLSMGRHSNDEMLSFYMMTPSGMELEIGWGGLQVNESEWNVKQHSVPSSWGHQMQMPPGMPPGTE